MEGIYHEIVARLFRAIVNSCILVPGNFVGASKTPAISSELRQSPGFLYPLEKCFICVLKHSLCICFDEIENVHFACSDVSGHFFDFEIIKNGNAMVFSSVGKEEFNKLFDYALSRSPLSPLFNVIVHYNVNYNESVNCFAFLIIIL